MKDKKIRVEGEPYWASEIVRRVTVRPVRAEEAGRWQELVRKHHYLGLHRLVGETVLDLAEVDGRWVALLGWCSAALKVKARDQWIGWNPPGRRTPTPFYPPPICVHDAPPSVVAKSPCLISHPWSGVAKLIAAGTPNPVGHS